MTTILACTDLGYSSNKFLFSTNCQVFNKDTLLWEFRLKYQIVLSREPDSLMCDWCEAGWLMKFTHDTHNQNKYHSNINNSANPLPWTGT